jgi:hypothetical protein
LIQNPLINLTNEERIKIQKEYEIKINENEQWKKYLFSIEPEDTKKELTKFQTIYQEIQTKLKLIDDNEKPNILSYKESVINIINEVKSKNIIEIPVICSEINLMEKITYYSLRDLDIEILFEEMLNEENFNFQIKDKEIKLYLFTNTLRNLYIIREYFPYWNPPGQLLEDVSFYLKKEYIQYYDDDIIQNGKEMRLKLLRKEINLALQK